MYIMCLIFFKEKAEVHDQYPLSRNPVQKADDPIQDHNRSIGLMITSAYLSISLNYKSINIPIAWTFDRPKIKGYEGA